MKISKEITKYFRYKFEYDFNYKTLDFCRKLKNELGGREFNFYLKAWRFNNPSIVNKIINVYPYTVVDDDLMLEMASYEKMKDNEKKNREEIIAIKNKKTSDLQINGIKGELYNFQKVCIEFFIKTGGRAILSLPMGSGKTLVSLAYSVLTKKKKILVVCPASIKWNWNEEVEKWTDYKAFTFYGKTQPTENIYINHDIFIINYDILYKFVDWIDDHFFDICICDEIHYAKSLYSRRSKMTRKITKKIKNVLLLSGTWILSRHSEAFVPLNIIDSQQWGSWHSYIKRFCGFWQAPWGPDFSRSTNAEELKQLIDPYYIRFKKDDILPDLPPKRYIDISIELDSQFQRIYNLAYDNFKKYLISVKEKTNKEIKRTLQAEKLVKLNELRQIACEGKVKAAEEIINNILENENKVVVFCNYRTPLHELYNKFKKGAVIITGESGDNERKEAVHKFQNNKRTRIFLGGLMSTGIGINLTASNTILFLSYDWVPGVMKQCENRCHRIGSTGNNITIYQLIAKNTIDEKMRETLREKQTLINYLMGDDDKVGAGNSLVNDVLYKIKKEVCQKI